MKRSSSNPLLLLASAALLPGCNPEPPSPGPTERAQPNTASLPLADPPLDREALLTAVAGAASDWAAGHREPQLQRELDGKRFELKLRFGCSGEDMASRQWSFSRRERVLRIQVPPEIAGHTPLLADLGLDDFEAAEGFWLHRPWLLEAVCPAPGPGASRTDPPAAAPADGVTEPQSSGPEIGIAQFYTRDDSRTARRDARAYEATIKLGEGEAPSSQGYDLVLSGRLARQSDGRAILCTGRSAIRPSCVISARFDHVAVARPDGEILAQWSSG